MDINKRAKRAVRRMDGCVGGQIDNADVWMGVVKAKRTKHQGGKGRQAGRQASKQASHRIRRSGIMMIGSGPGSGYRKMSLFVRQAAAIDVFSSCSFLPFPRSLHRLGPTGLLRVGSSAQLPLAGVRLTSIMFTTAGRVVGHARLFHYLVRG
jgi:hypothetical protein